jgi:hypothetical protein
MTNETKLRALLAEARDGLFDEGEEVVHHLLTCPCWACNLARRIDAALAEPVGECARCETLQDIADRAAWAQGDAQRRMIKAQQQRLEARAEVAAAYQRGAEAMREAAAAYIEANSPRISANGITLSLAGAGQKIRALPLPEVKP